MATSQVLPIEIIRQHTKTDDDPAISDTLLALYRRAALEEAERWTGWGLSGRRTITEFLTLPKRRSFASHLDLRSRPFITIYLKNAPNNGRVIVNGGGLENPLEVTATGADGRAIHLNQDIFPSQLNCCEGGCGERNPLTATYSIGADCDADVPAVILLGALQLIAYYISHPGDVIGYNGVTDAVRQSGAAEVWARFSRVAA